MNMRNDNVGALIKISEPCTVECPVSALRDVREEVRHPAALRTDSGNTLCSRSLSRSVFPIPFLLSADQVYNQA